MKRSKIILIFTAFLAVAAICLSVFAAANGMQWGNDG